MCFQLRAVCQTTYQNRDILTNSKSQKWPQNLTIQKAILAGNFRRGTLNNLRLDEQHGIGWTNVFPFLAFVFVKYNIGKIQISYFPRRSNMKGSICFVFFYFFFLRKTRESDVHLRTQSYFCNCTIQVAFCLVV